MSDLTARQLGTLQRKLENELAHTIDLTRDEMSPELKANYIDVDGNVSDIGDDSVADLLVDTDNAMIGRHLQQIRDDKAALERIRNGAYGVCIECGAEIGYQRLNAYPAAKRCVDCQERHEKTFAG